jgi:hypothetical protein
MRTLTKENSKTNITTLRTAPKVALKKDICGMMTVPRMLIFYCAAEINHPRNAAWWEIARLDQEEQFASRISSRSQVNTALIIPRQIEQRSARPLGL